MQLRTSENNLFSPIIGLGEVDGNRLWVKRDDLIPFSFGGNKARKALLFFDEVDQGGYDCVVTYGSGRSNHCRVVANMCAQRGIPCHVVSPRGHGGPSFNGRMVRAFGATVEEVPVEGVHDALEAAVARFSAQGRRPYLIEGGGHGDLGTEAYVRCHGEIRHWERSSGVRLDRVYHASGTGTTQAGLVCGKLCNGHPAEVFGVSVARTEARGRPVVVESALSYLRFKGLPADPAEVEPAVNFLDGYVGGGYGGAGGGVAGEVSGALARWGLPLDSTYTGKAFHGMREHLRSQGAAGLNVLFVHTGGTPIFFDDLEGSVG